MEVRRNERLGLLEVWVPRSERGLEATQRQLNALCAACKGTCTVAVFYSGEENLTERTSWLLCAQQRKQTNRCAKEKKA